MIRATRHDPGFQVARRAAPATVRRRDAALARPLEHEAAIQPEMRRALRRKPSRQCALRQETLISGGRQAVGRQPRAAIARSAGFFALSGEIHPELRGARHTVLSRPLEQKPPM